MDRFKPLKKLFFERDTQAVARELLGKYIIVSSGRRKLAVKIVETEAYGDSSDKGCHATRYGRTKRTAQLFGEPATAYVYAVHVNRFCFNIVAHEKSSVGAVLVRAAEPVEGTVALLKNRKKPKDCPSHLFLDGPAKLCEALKFRTELTGADLLKGKIFVAEGEKVGKTDIESTARINIPYAEESRFLKWRYIIKDCPFISKVKP